MWLHNGHISMVNYFRREVKRRTGVDVKCAFLEYSNSDHYICLAFLTELNIQHWHQGLSILVNSVKPSSR